MTKKQSGAPRGAKNGRAKKDVTDAIRREIRRDKSFSARRWARQLDVFESTVYRIRRAK